MTFKEMVKAIEEAKSLWDKIWPDVKGYARDTKAYLVIDSPIERDEAILPVSDVNLFLKNKGYVPKRYRWLGTEKNISPFAVEVRFDSLNMPLIRAIRRHPLVCEIEGQKEWSDACIRVFLYVYKGE